MLGFYAFDHLAAIRGTHSILRMSTAVRKNV